MTGMKLYAATAACLAMLAAGTAEASYGRVVVFGDSLSDGGNVYNTLSPYSIDYPPSPPYAQRFTNGPAAVEVMAANMGLPLTASTVGGTNYAYGGAMTGWVSNGTGTYDNYVTYAYGLPLDGTGIDKQVRNMYDAGADPLIESTLFVVWGGPNDLFLNPSVDTALQAAANIIDSIAYLMGHGADHFLVPNMPNLSAVPIGQGTPLGLLSSLFNGTLAAGLDGLSAADPDARIIRFDTDATLQYVIAHAGDYGLTNTADPCFTGVSLCANPDQYLFWDAVHPTARAHQILGRAFAAAVPEPGAYALLGLGLLALSAGRARRSPTASA